VYILVYFFVIISAFYSLYISQISSPLSKITFILPLVLVVIFIGTKTAGLDGDYFAYYAMYNMVPLYQDLVSIEQFSGIHGELGYLFSNTIFKSLGWSFSSYYFFTVFFNVFGKYYFYSQSSKKPYLCLMLYFLFSLFLIEFIQFRWGMALTLLSISLMLLKKVRYTLSFIFLIVSFLFHTLTIVCLPFYIFWLLSKKIYVNYWSLFLAPLVFLIIGRFFGISLISDIVGIFYPDVVRMIMQSKYYDGLPVSNTLLAYYLIQYVIVCFLFWNVEQKRKCSPFYVLLYSYLFSMQCLFSFSAIMSERFYGLIILVLPIVLVESLWSGRYRFNKLTLSGLLCIFICMHIYMTNGNIFQANALQEYSSWLF
jgi:hypothetical protein